MTDPNVFQHIDRGPAAAAHLPSAQPTLCNAIKCAPKRQPAGKLRIMSSYGGEAPCKQFHPMARNLFQCICNPLASLGIKQHYNSQPHRSSVPTACSPNNRATHSAKPNSAAGSLRSGQWQITATEHHTLSQQENTVHHGKKSSLWGGRHAPITQPRTPCNNSKTSTCRTPAQRDISQEPKRSHAYSLEAALGKSEAVTCCACRVMTGFPACFGDLRPHMFRERPGRQPTWAWREVAVKT